MQRIRLKLLLGLGWLAAASEEKEHEGESRTQPGVQPGMNAGLLQSRQTASVLLLQTVQNAPAHRPFFAPLHCRPEECF